MLSDFVFFRHISNYKAHKCVYACASVHRRWTEEWERTVSTTDQYARRPYKNQKSKSNEKPYWFLFLWILQNYRVRSIFGDGVCVCARCAQSLFDIQINVQTRIDSFSLSLCPSLRLVYAPAGSHTHVAPFLNIKFIFILSHFVVFVDGHVHCTVTVDSIRSRGHSVVPSPFGVHLSVSNIWIYNGMKIDSMRAWVRCWLDEHLIY